MRPHKTANGLVAALLLTGTPALAQTAASFPAKPVRIIAPFAPGANADLIGRIVAQRVSPVWGQPVLLDNRPGGSTNTGTEQAARSPADGYTLLLQAPPLAINMSLFRKLPYDTLRDFAPIILLTRVPNVMSVHPSVPARSVKELVALAKARPGQLNFGSGGQGSANHMAAELLKLTAGITSDVGRIIAAPDVRKRLIDDGQEPGGGSPEDFVRFLRNEIGKYAQVIKAAGLRGE